MYPLYTTSTYAPIVDVILPEDFSSTTSTPLGGAPLSALYNKSVFELNTLNKEHNHDNTRHCGRGIGGSGSGSGRGSGSGSSSGSGRWVGMVEVVVD